MNKPLITVRWAARILSAAIMLSWSYFIAAHLIGGNEPSPRPLVVRDYIGIGAMILSLAGLAVAWKREFAGSVITLGAVLIGVAGNWRVLLFPGSLIPLAAVLFLFCWWMSRPSPPEQARSEPPSPATAP